MLEVTEPTQLHNGGQLHFGPDGLLYMSFGDGGPAGDPENHAQDLELRSLRVAEGTAVEDASLGVHVPALSSFGVDAQGRLYALSLDGPVYRIARP